MTYIWTGIAVIAVAAAVVTVRAFRPRPLPAPEPWTGPLPDASPPPGMTIHQLPTGTYEGRAALLYRGGSPRDVRHLAATAVLVRHPGGDLLIDAGFGADVDAHLAMLPSFQRTPHTFGRTAWQQLRDAGHDPERLLGVVITHAHWDHVSGLDSLPVPVWMNADEEKHAERAKDAAVYRRVIEGREVRRYAFDGPAYLGFPASHDVHGDGSVVIVPAGGHTEGSVVVFVTLPDGTRFAFIGDLTWQMEGVTLRAERPAVMRMVADVHPAGTRTGLLRVIALSGRMHVVPSHDTGAYDVIPRMSQPVWGVGEPGS